MTRRAAHIVSCILFFLGLPAHATTGCLSPDAIPMPLRSAKTIVLGELHGTAQGPAFAAALACALSHLGTPVLLGLEIPVSEQPAINTYLSGGSEQDFRTTAQSSSFWVRERHDGRASAAVLALLQQVRELRAHGAKLDVLAFDPPPSRHRTSDTRDRLMAEQLRAAHAGAPGATLVVFVGSYHAKRSPAPASDTLADALGPGSVVALRMQHSGGTAWVCRGETYETLACGSVEFDSPEGPTHDHSAIFLDPKIEPGFDGVFYVGHIEASPPAFRRGNN